MSDHNTSQDTPVVRRALESIIHQAREGHIDNVIQTAQRTLQALDAEHLLTTREAAQALGIRSVNTLKALVVRDGIPYRRVGNRMMLSLADVERLRDSTMMRGLCTAEALHDSIEDLGPHAGLSARELTDLEAARPGHLPWRTPSVQEAARTVTDDSQAPSERTASHA